MSTATATPATASVARDFTGREIKQGDSIVYAGRRGSETYLKNLYVTGVFAVGSKFEITGINPGAVPQRQVRLKNLDTIAVVGRE
jgi:hypothetical protein